jgi:GNAT superfamily N-acetyltransferase
VIELRQEPPDAPAALDLYEQYMEFVGERAGVRMDERVDIFGTPDLFQGPGTAWVVLYDDGRPAGCGGLREAEPGIGEIRRMFVAAGARRRGHGRRLLAELERLAREFGYRRVRLFTTSMLTEALALYAAAGYNVVDRPLEGDRHDFVMEKALTVSRTR